MPQVTVFADHLRFEGEHIPMEQWAEFDLLYGCMESLPQKPEEHILLLGVRCFHTPEHCTEKAYLFIRKSAIVGWMDH